MKLNTAKKKDPIYTQGGAKAARTGTAEQLRRSVMTCMLWEDSFYEDGMSIAERIESLVMDVDAKEVAEIAIEAREQMKLRHIPLLLVRQLAKKEIGVKTKMPDGLIRDTLARVIQRPDELSEFMAIYWKDGKCPLSGQVKKGLAMAFQKFDEYALAKYNRDAAIKLRDVLFLCHAKPKDKEQEILWKKLISNELKTPDTWEVALSAGGDKTVEWSRLLIENKLGALALIRNLRNMEQAGVDPHLIRNALSMMKTERVLPFRFINAAKHAPKLESELEQAMFKCLEGQVKLKGKTILIVDTSGSMHSGNVSRKSDLTRVDAATALAILIREVSEYPVIYATAGNDHTQIHSTALVPARRGFALSDAIWGDNMRSRIGGGGIFLAQVMDYVYTYEKEADRVIVITDEQDCDQKCTPATANAFGKKNYLINVSVEKNGINFGKWVSLHGWSEAIVGYIQATEMGNNQ